MRGVTLSVSQLNDYVRRSLAGDPILQVLTVRGEVTNYKPSASGHLYFSLKDENCCIDCVLFRQYAGNLKFRP